MVIGLDGATYDLIIPWIKEGHLPTFKRLLEEGSYGELESTLPHATIPAWPSFATGCNPGKHGFFDFYKEKRNSYDLMVEMSPSTVIKRPTLWEILSEYNKKVAVINVPGTFPPKAVNGIVISGLLTPPGVRFTYPKDFEKELMKKVKGYSVFFSALSAKNPKILLDDLIDTLDKRIKAVQYIWEDRQPDFLMMVVSGTDRAEHELFKYMDPENPLYDEEDVKKYGNPLLDYYKEVDKGLKRILELIDENTYFMLMSDHGQGSLRYFINLNSLLISKGLMKISKNPLSKVKYGLFKMGYTPMNIYNILRKFGIERMATDKVGKKKRLSLLNKFFFSTSDIDWKRTKAFASGVTGSITINLKGRQPQGCVGMGNEYEKIRDEIIKMMKELKHQGEKTIKDIHKREDIYKGPYVKNAPDIVAVPEEYYEFFGMYGFTFNKIIVPTFGNSGSHRMNGIFYIKGKGVKKNYKLKNLNILQVTPTICSIFDLKLDNTFDGKIIEKAFINNKIDHKMEMVDLEKICIKNALGKIKLKI